MFRAIPGPVRYFRGGTHWAVLGLWAMLAVANHAFADNGVGAWVSPSGSNWPLVPIHATLMPDGRVVTYGTRHGPQLIYDVWDPADGITGPHLTLPNQDATNIFCGAQVLLPQTGTLFMAGGKSLLTSVQDSGTNYTNLFDYTSNTLTRGNNMNRARYYATTTTLTTGEVYIQGGNNGADFPEVRDVTGNFRLLTGAPTSTYGWYYPRNFVAPDGRIFGFDDRGVMYYAVPQGTGSLAMQSRIQKGYLFYHSSSAVMYQPGKILKFGGNLNNALTIDLTAMTPKLSVTGNLSSGRNWVTATMLPDGRVLATGGSAVSNQLTGVNNSAEIWDPNTGIWTVGASGAIARLYHSFALLLPDASVLVGGGGDPGPLENFNAEIYYPPYLYNSDGTSATRPTINSAPTALNINDTFNVMVTASATTRVTLVKTGAVTHSFNMDQRFLELPFTDMGGGLLSVTAPTSASAAPPGYYLLFVIDNNGAPSVGQILAINVQADGGPPTQPATASVALSGGKPLLTWSTSTDDVGVA